MQSNIFALQLLFMDPSIAELLLRTEIRNLLGLALKCTWAFAMYGQEMLVLFNTVGLCVLNT